MLGGRLARISNAMSAAFFLFHSKGG